MTRPSVEDLMMHLIQMSQQATQFIMDARTTKALSDAYDRCRAEREADKARQEANGNGE
jgi:hypothetical protein